MQCPYCDSTQVRKASAVYEDGTSITKSRTRGAAIGIGGHPASLGVGGFAGRSRGRSTTLAARKADKSRISWVGPRSGLGLFLLLCIAFAWLHIYDPFSKALAVTLAIMIGCPLLTAITSARNNQGYDRRWYCDTCGEIWTGNV